MKNLYKVVYKYLHKYLHKSCPTLAIANFANCNGPFILSLPKIFFSFLKPIEFDSYYNYKNYHFASCNTNI